MYSIGLLDTYIIYIDVLCYCVYEYIYISILLGDFPMYTLDSEMVVNDEVMAVVSKLKERDLLIHM